MINDCNLPWTSLISFIFQYKVSSGKERDQNHPSTINDTTGTRKKTENISARAMEFLSMSSVKTSLRKPCT